MTDPPSDHQPGAFFELGLDPLALLDLQGRLLRVNRGWWADLALAPEDVVGRPLAALAHPDDRAPLAAALEEAADERLEVRARLRDGGGRWRLLRIRLQRQAAEGPILASLVEVPAPQETSSDTTFRSVVMGAAEAFFVHDMTGRIIDANPAACESLGYSHDELLGMHVGDFEESLASGEVEGIWSRMRPGEPATVEGTHRRKDGSTFPVEVRLGLFEYGDELAMLALARDVTARRQAEAALRKLNEELTAARDQAIEASRAKSAFLASMSHELRTPLNAIIGYTELLRDDAEEEDRDEQIADLDRVLVAARHLLALINDVLDLSKIEAGRMEVVSEPFELAFLVEEVATTIRPLAAQNRNRLEIVVEPAVGRVVTDRTKLRQTLLNLLGNACKFTEGGTITLRARRERREDGEWLAVAVSDTGIGIAREDLPRVFQAFTQGDGSPRRRHGGTGLGLAISRRLCRMLGGDLLVASQPGRGSTFEIMLPTEPPAEPDEVVPLAPADGDAPHVLVVDDDPTVHDLLRRLLGREGYRVTCASDGQEGIRMAELGRPDLILLDVLMPGLDGWAVLRALKSRPELVEVPVVLISILADARSALGFGAADYLPKPIERRALLDLVRRYGGEGAAGRALVVEDDDDMRELVHRALERHGWKVREAANGREAMVSLAEEVPDLVLLDLMMPEMDGFEVVAAMRADERWRDVPVVVCTAMELGEEEWARLRGKVERVVQKGSQRLEELAAMVRRHLGNARRVPDA